VRAARGWSLGRASTRRSSSSGTDWIEAPRSPSRRANARSISPASSAGTASTLSISRTETVRCGYASFNCSINPGSTSNMAVEIAPMVSIPDCPPSASSTASSRRSSCSANLRTAGRIAAPTGVSLAPRRERSNNLTLSACSSTWICSLSGGWDMPRRLAARPKFCSSATARNSHRCRIRRKLIMLHP